MALVRISKQLITDVEGQCGIMRNAEIQEVAAPSATFDGSQDPAAAYLATEITWGEHLHLKHQMPASWLKHTTCVQLMTRYQHDDGHNELTQAISYAKVGIPVPPSTTMGYNYSTHEHNCLNVTVPYELVEQAAADESHRFHTVASAIMAMVNKEKRGRKINKAWEDRIGQIRTFLHKCKSLNEAIKLWPQIKLYVPKSYIDTVETPVVRSQAVVRKERTLENVDTDGLTAAAIAAKLAGVI